MSDGVRVALRHGPETLDLNAREPIVRLVSRCEVAHHADDGRRVDLPELFRGHAPTPHAGVYLQVHGQTGGELRRRGGDLEPRRAGQLVLSRRERPEDEDPGVSVRATQRLPLGDRGDAQRRRSGLQKRSRDVERPVAVGVCLDDRPELGGLCGLAHAAHVTA